MNILGLHLNTGQTAAALLRDGQITAAAAEERFDRVKRSRAFPVRAIRHCLREAGLENLEDLNGIAISWNPGENMRHINLSGFTSWRRYDPEWLYIAANNLMSIAGENAFGRDVLKMEIGAGAKCPLYFVTHHYAHLAHAACQSPFDEGLAVAVDEYGEFDSVTIASFKGNDLNVLKTIPYPNSLGVFYAAFTEYLGFAPNADEWKVMGAAAYGDGARYAKKLEEILQWDAKSGVWILDTRFVEHANMKRAGYLNERLEAYVGLPRRAGGGELTQAHFDLAASAQAVFEKRLFQMLTFHVASVKTANLAASGGCFMNSLANGKIVANTPFQRVFIPYAAADNGGAMGAPLYVWNYLLRNTRKPVSAPTPFLGPEYSDAEIEETLKRYRLPFDKSRDVCRAAAELIAEGKLVGWFQGRMEFGERALGNRSILADPRDELMKEKINSAVKYREAFRPFAPSIMGEHVSEFFEIPEGAAVPYMEQVYPVKQGKRAAIPAVVHADGTGRLQTVSEKENPLFHRVIAEFYKITGIPLVLNTSFNVQGEPIVCTPSDALRTFFTCGLDAVILGSFILRKCQI